MTNLDRLEQYINGLEFYSNSIELIISVKRELANNVAEWQTIVSIEIKSHDIDLCPNVNVCGQAGYSIDDVAKDVLQYLKDWKRAKTQ